MKKILLTALCAVSLSAFASGDAKQEASHAPAVHTAPAEETAQQCVACHGEGGVSTIPTFPVLAGQHRGYLEHALKAYKTGERKNPIMKGLAGALTDADIEGLAIYFSKQHGGLK
jgi:cytochrome c553